MHDDFLNMFATEITKNCINNNDFFFYSELHIVVIVIAKSLPKHMLFLLSNSY